MIAIAPDPATPPRAGVNVCHSELGAGTSRGRTILLPHDRVLVRGWAYDATAGEPTITAVAGDRRIAIPLGFERLDVLAFRGLGAARSGFEARIEGLGTMEGPFELQIVARFGDGPEYRIGPAYAFVGVLTALSPTPDLRNGIAVGRIRRLADTRPEPFPPGWKSRRSIRPDAAIEIEGWALDDGGPPRETRVSIRGRGIHHTFSPGRTFDGEATTAAGANSWFESGFHCLVDAELFPPGLYDAEILVHTRDGSWQRGPATAFQIAPKIAEIAPAFLPIAREPAQVHIERFAPLDPVRGEPVAIEGWTRDPATDRGGPVFVAFDDEHPLPIPAQLARPDVADDHDEVGFAGIADTADLPAGPHRLRLLSLAPSGALWHVLDEREVLVR
jgi:hypothetical protein